MAEEEKRKGKLKWIFIFVIALGIISIFFDGEGNNGSSKQTELILYEIVNKSEMATIKLSIDVQVPLINGRLPNQKELGALSNYLVSKERKHERSFVSFYLPNMRVGEGAYATAHHNPDMKVNIMKFMLAQYPEYKNFSQ